MLQAWMGMSQRVIKKDPFLWLHTLLKMSKTLATKYPLLLFDGVEQWSAA